MRKYVAKEDVEKGLVDPTKSLEEQPEYKKKIEQQAHEREKLNEQKQPQHHRQKKERPPRNERPKFNWNRRDVTLQTKAPEKPIKLIQKPDAQKYNEGLEKLKAERGVLKTERNALIEEKGRIIRDINESKKTGKAVITQYSGVMREKMGMENNLRKEIKALDNEKKKILSEIEDLKDKVQELKKPEKNEGYSLQYLKKRVAEKEHELTTSNIGKKEETKLTVEINNLKRAMTTARPQIQIQSEMNKIQDQISILYKQLKPIKDQLHEKIPKANAIRQELDSLKEQKKSEQGNLQETRTIQEIKAEYDAKIQAVDAKRDKLEDRIDDYMDKHTREIDDYEDQQDLLRYISWVEEQVEHLKKKKEEEEKKKKQWEEREKKRQKEKEEYQKRKEERKKQDQERKARDEERKKKQEQERERFINRNPNHQIIDLCQTLVDYCESLRPSHFQKYEDPRTKQTGELNFGKQWQKQLKSGAEVVVSKKAKQDQPNKKEEKPKKKQQKKEDEDFVHGIEVVNQFQGIKLLPPKNAAEIDSTIKLIQDKIGFYNNPTEEEKAAFREKAAREYDERNAHRENKRQGGQGNYKQKREKEEEEEQHPKQKKTSHHHRKQKKEFKEGDFPGLS